MDLVKILTEKTEQAIKKLDIETKDWKPIIIPCKIPNVDFTVNNIGSLFKFNKKEKVSASLVDLCKNLLMISDGMYDVEICKIYINFKLNKKILYQNIQHILELKSTITQTDNPSTILVDYSSPNVAKDMHVGHLRSTIIGDCLANVYEARGNRVLRINHIGDFGLQFGMIIQYIISEKLMKDLLENKLSLQEVYTKAKKKFDSDDEFNKLSYANTVKLQNYDNPKDEIPTDPATEDPSNVVTIWRAICDISRKSYQDIYDKLSVNLTECGESFYAKYIPAVIKELTDKKLTIVSEGRLIVETPHGVLTLIKSDGGYTYDTTDITALWYRLCVLKVNKIYYVVDSGQSTHFLQLFDVVTKMGWNTEKSIEHVNFGVVCGEDGKRMRSRSGDTLKLADLMQYSLEETKKVMVEKGKSIDEKTIQSIAYGSIKYADLSVQRISDYVFSFERMLSFKGNTLSYVMYARVRLMSVINKLRNSPDHSISTEDIIKYISDHDPKKFDELNKSDYELIFHLIIK
jgi:arginyl-tRNA synthetase